MEKHYLFYHTVDPNNYFFKDLFLCDNGALLVNYTRCDDFISTKQHPRQHNFLMNYENGKEMPVEKKTLDIVETKYMVKYEISYEKHSDYYNFFSSEDLIEDFLTNVRIGFKTTDYEVSIMCGFSIQNLQGSPTLINVLISNSRYWSTSVYRTVYFNDHVYFQLGQDIRKRVIINGLSGSSWHFQKFNYLNLKVLKRLPPLLKK